MRLFQNLDIIGNVLRRKLINVAQLHTEFRDCCIAVGLLLASQIIAELVWYRGAVRLNTSAFGITLIWYAYFVALPLLASTLISASRESIALLLAFLYIQAGFILLLTFLQLLGVADITIVEISLRILRPMLLFLVVCAILRGPTGIVLLRGFVFMVLLIGGWFLMAKYLGEPSLFARV
ncbi:MAG: hypothetical protein ABJ251_04650 [Paracoccaceae bacterium]